MASEQLLSWLPFHKTRKRAGDQPDLPNWYPEPDAKEPEGFWARVRSASEMARSIGISVTIVSFVAVGAILLLMDIPQEKVIMEPIRVPKELEERGFTSQVVVFRLMDEVHQIKQKGGIVEQESTYKPQSVTGVKSADQAPNGQKSAAQKKNISVTQIKKQRASVAAEWLVRDLKIPGTDISVRAITGLFKEALGVTDTRIGGEIVIRDLTTSPSSVAIGSAKDVGFHLRLRISGRQSRVVDVNPRPLHNLDELFADAAEQIVRQTDPYVLVSYYYSNKSDRLDGAFLLCDSRCNSKDKAEAYELWGRYFLDRLEYADAVKKFDHALNLDKKLVVAHTNRGFALAAMGRLEEAVRSYAIATRLNSNDAVPYSNWGNALAGLRRPAEAIEKYKKAVLIDPNYAFAYNNWGNALSDMRRLAEAIEKYKKAVDIDPNYASAYFN